MAASKELITKIVLRGQVDGSLTKALSTVSKHSETSLNKLSQYGQKLTNAFKTAAVGIGTAAVMAAKSAIDYESAFAGVKKTVDETNTTSYEKLSDGIRQLSKETPAAATEIAAVAEAAGQLGIKADDILSFSKVMIDLGESTNLTADDAATSIAKLFNVTGTSMDQVQNFGSTLVALGNNAATTETDILAMATRIAGSGKQIGLSEQQILALSTSLSSVGIEAEMGGSAISTIMSQIDKSVGLNSETMAVWAQTAGMSASQFAASWNKDAYGTLQKVLTGMSNTKAEGGNLNVLLEELGINSIRQGDTLKRLSSATGLMSEMTDLANKSWDENIALSKEANTRYATMASKLKIAKNKITDAAITIGNKLMPVLDKLLAKFDKIDMDAVAQKISDTIQWIIDNFDKVKIALGFLGVAFAAFKIGGFINTMAGACKELKMLSDTMGLTAKLTNAGGITGAFKSIGVTAKGAFAKAGAAIAAVPAPVLIVIAIIAVLAAAFATLWKNNEEFRSKMTAIWNSIKDTVSGFCDGLVERINSLGFDFKNITEVLSAVWTGFCNLVAPLFETVFQDILITLSTTLDTILSVVDFFIALFKGDWQGCWNAVVQIFSTLWNDIVSHFKNWINLLRNTADVILGWFGTSWSECWSSIKTFFVNTWNSIVSFFTVTIPNAFNSVVNFFAQIPGKIGAWLSSTWQKITAWGANLWAKAKEIGSNFVNGIVNFFKKLPYYIGYVIGFVIGKIAAFGVKLWNFATVTIPQFIGKVVEWFKQLPGKIWTWLVNTWNKFVAWRNNMYAQALAAGRNVLNAVVSFFKQLPGKVWTWLTNTASKITAWGARIISIGKQKATAFLTAVVNFFRQLPGKVWTWLVTTAQKVVAWGPQLVAKGRKAAADLSNSIVNKIKELPGKLLTLGKNIVQGLWNGIKGAKDWLSEKIKSFCSGIVDGFTSAFKIGSPSKVMEKLFKWLPIGAGNGIIDNAKYAVKAVQSMGGKITSAASKIAPGFSVSGLPKYGTGGTVTTPHTAIVGDKAETIVPHGNTKRNRSLLAEAASGVGASLGGGNTISFTFAPVISGGNAEENRTMIREEEEKFERMMNEWLAKNRRLGFNGG